MLHAKFWIFFSQGLVDKKARIYLKKTLDTCHTEINIAEIASLYVKPLMVFSYITI